MTFPDEELLIDSRSLFILTILESPVTLRVVVPTPIISNSCVKDSFIPYDLPSVNSYLTYINAPPISSEALIVTVIFIFSPTTPFAELIKTLADSSAFALITDKKHPHMTSMLKNASIFFIIFIFYLPHYFIV